MPRRKSEQERRAAQAAGAYLYELLLKKERYYRQWLPAHRQGTVPTKVDHDAVALVLHRRYCEDRELSFDPKEDRAHIHKKWKDTISRAFKGTTLTSGTLKTFHRSFNMSHDDYERLEALLAGQERAPASGEA